MPVADLLPQIPPLALIDRRFVVEAPIGADGMASVYRARDRLTGKIVALKLVTLPEGDSFVRLRGREAPVVEREVTVASDGATRAPTGVPAKIDPNATVASVDDPAVAPNVDLDDARRRALRLLAIIQEFKLLSGLRHPNVINVYDYGVDGGQPYFTMELLEGAKTITEVAWTLPRPERVRLLVQVLAALQYLHRHDLLHRDIKPGNVLVVGDRVQVLDFGVSVRRDRVTDIAGTTLYMAPEVLRGNPPTASSDLYGFGVMAFEVLVGVRPFGLEDPRSIEIDFELLLSEPETRVDARTGGSEQEPRPRSAVVRSSQPRSSQRDSNTRRRMPPTDRLHVVLSRLLSVSMRGRYESARDVMEDLCAAIGDPPPFEDATIRESYLQAAPLVGRASELRRLDLALTSARESKGDAFVVVGESGVGKSRLVDELRTRCAVSGAEVVRGQALREGNAPFQIFREPVRQLALRAGVADEDATLLKVVAPDLARILDRPISPPPPIDPAILHQQIIGAVLKLLTRSDRPIVLILEDLHWMQDDSAMLLARCAAASRGSRLLIVGTARDDEAGDLKARFPGMTPIAVDRLSRPEVSDLAGMMIGPEGREPSLAEYLFRQSEGNCFFLVETMRALADRAGRLDRVAEIELPQRLSTRGVASVVEARLGRVPVDASKILDLAAVLGRDFDADLLQHALPESDVERLLAQAGTIVEPSGRRWRFAHDKLREEILRRLRADQRRALHVLAALAIEAKGDRAAEAAALAHHWGQANHPQKEIEYAQVAGDQLLAAGAQAGALVQLRRVAELLPTIADLADRDRRELSLRLSLGTALLATRGHASSEMRAAFDRAAVLCRDVGDRAQLFHVLFGQSTSCLFRGELRTALELAEQCLVIAEAIDDADLKIQSEFAIGNAAYWMSDFPRADAKLARVLTLHDPNRTPVHLQRFGHDPRTTCLTFGAWTSVACGRYERAAAQADEALDRAQNMGHPFAMAIAIQIAAITHQQLRNVAPARRFAESLLDMPEAFPTYRVCGMFISGWCDLDSGRSGAGIEAMLQAWAMWRAIGAGLAHGYYAVMLAQAYAVGGRWAEGLAMIDDARAVAIGRGERAFESELLRVRGELLAGQGSLFEAELELRNARAVAIDRGALGFELTATTSLARLLDKAGKRGDARTVLEPIIDRFSSATGARHVEAALALSSSLS